jgi:seryl-tRNA synthetase
VTQWHQVMDGNRPVPEDRRAVSCPVVIDQRLLRTDLEGLRTAIARRARPALVDEVERAARLDQRLRSITAERDQIRARVNAISKEVGQLRRDGDVDGATVHQDESRALGGQEKVLAAEHDEVSAALSELLLDIPNLPHPDAPDGADDHANPVVKGPIALNAAYFEHQRVPHWEAATELGILDNERAVKISGAMFTMQRGAGATLARALCQFALDLNADEHEEVRVPSLVSSATLTATGQLPKFADDAYAIERDDLWCSPTAEAPLTSIHADETLDDTELPIRLMAYSSSFRREAGSAGRDTRGMLRAHEFDKVELMAYATPEQAPGLLDDMVARSEKAISLLELPYRIIEICAGDMGQSHHRSFDIEVYAPGADAWLEVSSVSWLGDYQARRAGIRFRRHDDEGRPLKGTEFVHTLNDSALAVPRVWAAIVENYRNSDGSVTVPRVLRPYMRGIDRIDRIEPRVADRS